MPIHADAAQAPLRPGTPGHRAAWVKVMRRGRPQLAPAAAFPAREAAAGIQHHGGGRAAGQDGPGSLQDSATDCWHRRSHQCSSTIQTGPHARLNAATGWLGTLHTYRLLPSLGSSSTLPWRPG